MSGVSAVIIACVCAILGFLTGFFMGYFHGMETEKESRPAVSPPLMHFYYSKKTRPAGNQVDEESDWKD